MGGIFLQGASQFNAETKKIAVGRFEEQTKSAKYSVHSNYNSWLGGRIGWISYNRSGNLPFGKQKQTRHNGPTVCDNTHLCNFDSLFYPNQ